ncbi:MAG: deoxyribonuclease V [Candidatus Coatesbacteria bacterium]|nr:deoxyribonuclease V [Candidatus Coatesbacteria bacterium]
MKVNILHSWELSYTRAADLQRELALRIIRENHVDRHSLRHVAGTDVSYSRATNRCYCGVSVLSYPDLNVVLEETAVVEATFPYIPGLLSFREIPGLIDVFEALRITPDLIIVDGQGLAHPRRLGLACHLGLILDIPTIGCAKSRLIGEHEMPAATKGAQSDLLDKGEKVGVVLRSRTGVSPVYVSIGHRIDLTTAAELVLNCCPKYRLPETTRAAHRLVYSLMREHEQQ